MKYYFPIHLNGGNRGCEAISKRTALILKEKKENMNQTSGSASNFLIVMNICRF